MKEQSLYGEYEYSVPESLRSPWLVYRDVARRRQSDPSLIPLEIESLEAILGSGQEMPDVMYAELRHELAVAYSRCSSVDATPAEKALALVNQALEVFVPEKHPLTYALVMCSLGGILMQIENQKPGCCMKLAEECFQTALRHRPRDTVPSLRAATLWDLSVIHFRRSSGEDLHSLVLAAGCLSESLGLLDPGAEASRYSITYQNLQALWAAIKGRIVTLGTISRKQLNSMLNNANKYSVWTLLQALHMLGDSYLYDEELSVDSARRAETLYSLACERLSCQVSPIEQALFRLRVAESRAALCRMGSVRDLTDIYDQIGQLHRESSLITIPLIRAHVIFQIGAFFRGLDVGIHTANTFQAIACFEEARRSATEASDAFLRAQILNGLGNALMDLRVIDSHKAISKALECYDSALETILYSERYDLRSMILTNKGIALLSCHEGRSRHRLAEALECLEEALRLRKATGTSIDYGSTLFNIGVVCDELADQGVEGCYEKAVASYEEASEIFAARGALKQCSAACLGLAEAYMRHGTHDTARPIHEVISLLETAVEGFGAIAAHEERVLASQLLAKLYAKLGLWEDSYRELSTMLPLASQLLSTRERPATRSMIGASLRDFFFQASYAATRLGLYCDAIDLAEKGQSVAEYSALAVADVGLRHSIMEASARLRRAEIRSRVLSLDEAGDLDLLRLQDATDEMIEAALHIDALLASKLGEPPGVASEQHSVQPHNTGELSSPIVYMVATSEGCVTLVVLPGQVCEREYKAYWSDAMDSKTVDELLYDHSNTINLLHSAALDDRVGLLDWLASHLGTLGKELMQPIVDLLLAHEYRGCTIIPCGKLAFLPLHAGELASGKRVIDLIDISYLPSSSLLRVDRAGSSSTSHRIVAVESSELPQGHPKQYDKKGAGELMARFVGLEAESACSAFAKGCSTRLSGANASPDAVLDVWQDADYLHFACHGVFDPIDYLSSGLYLADGMVLSLHDVLLCGDLARAKLVVLSACQTALRDFALVPNDGFGLPTGFLCAGAHGVIGSMWVSSDLATFLLFRHFYGLHRTDGLAPASALREAQLWLARSTVRELDLVRWLRSAYDKAKSTDLSLMMAYQYYAAHPEERPFADPFFWAGFQYIGS